MKDEFLSIGISVIFLILFLFGGIWFLGHNKKEETENMEKQEIKKIIRKTAVAGQFYPSSPEELENQIGGFLNEAQKEKNDGEILGLVVPHAGYVYSGQVAAFGFAQLKNEDIETVILLGNSHKAFFEGAAVFAKGFFKTPLGEIEIDQDLAEKIIAEDKKIKADILPHEKEHSLEVELPFLQKVLKNFKIVPILLGNDSSFDPKILAKAISKNADSKKILILASSDLSHYPPFKKATEADKKTCEAILSGSVANLKETIARLEKEEILNAQTFLCGQEAVEVLMGAMQELEAKDIKLLKYANSGDVPSGDKSQVVGYGAIAFYGKRRGQELNQKEQKRLLEIARQSVESYVATGKAAVFSETNPMLNQKLGAFVTIKKNGQLRGCIGSFTDETNPPLFKTVSEMAVLAATQDFRFDPVGEKELPELKYEVSVLSPLTKIDNWQKIELGRHGVKIKNGIRSGVFLPQVADETSWDLENFMGQLCSQKAGLPWACWKEKETELYVFTAQVFDEASLNN